MSAGSEIEVYETPTFRKAFKKLSEKEKVRVEDEIDIITKKPDVGEQKKGDLSHLWVHKFNLNGQLALLGYSWVKERLELYLLNIGPHENFYRDAKKKRKFDLNFIR